MKEERCINCVLPTNAIGIKFDNNNSCELCSSMEELPHNYNLDNKEEIEKYIEDIRELGKNKPYDCLVGLSGGRDSSYLLYLLVKKHNLRCMAAYHRTPYTPDEIDESVRALTKKLNVPLVQMDISTKKHQSFARRMMILWIDKKESIFANLACAPCKQHNYEVYRVAKKHNISYIVFGGNKLETFHVGAGQSTKLKTKNTKQFSSLQRLKQSLIVGNRGFSLLLKHPKLIFDFPILFKASILYLNNSTTYLRTLYSDIKMLDYYYVAGYNEQKVINFLSDIGWKMPSNCNSTWRADCSFNEIKNYVFKREKGVTYVDAYLSNSIRANVLTRGEALKRVETEGKISKERLKVVCDLLKIPISSFELAK